MQSCLGLKVSSLDAVSVRFFAKQSRILEFLGERLRSPAYLRSNTEGLQDFGLGVTASSLLNTAEHHLKFQWKRAQGASDSAVLGGLPFCLEREVRWSLLGKPCECLRGRKISVCR